MNLSVPLLVTEDGVYRGQDQLTEEVATEEPHREQPLNVPAGLEKCNIVWILTQKCTGFKELWENAHYGKSYTWIPTWLFAAKQSLHSSFLKLFEILSHRLAISNSKIRNLEFSDIPNLLKASMVFKKFLILEHFRDQTFAFTCLAATSEFTGSSLGKVWRML